MLQFAGLLAGGMIIYALLRRDRHPSLLKFAMVVMLGAGTSILVGAVTSFGDLRSNLILWLYVLPFALMVIGGLWLKLRLIDRGKSKQ